MLSAMGKGPLTPKLAAEHGPLLARSAVVLAYSQLPFLNGAHA